MRELNVADLPPENQPERIKSVIRAIGSALTSQWNVIKTKVRLRVLLKWITLKPTRSRIQLSPSPKYATLPHLQMHFSTAPPASNRLCSTTSASHSWCVPFMSWFCILMVSSDVNSAGLSSSMPVFLRRTGGFRWIRVWRHSGQSSRRRFSFHSEWCFPDNTSDF